MDIFLYYGKVYVIETRSSRMNPVAAAASRNYRPVWRLSDLLVHKMILDRVIGELRVVLHGHLFEYSRTIGADRLDA
jgi:hypothetical protein